MVVFLSILVAILFVTCCLMGFYLVRFARYIMSIEDTLSEAIEVHQRTLESFNKIIELKVFFDDPSLIKVLQEVVDDTKICAFAVAKIIERFTSISKHKFIEIIKEDDVDK